MPEFAAARTRAFHAQQLVDARNAVTENVAGNRAYRWNEFDPYWYVAHNYVGLRDDDRRIMQVARDFFARHFSTASRRPLVDRGIDVGAGPNIFPALTMLPFCRTLTLWEYGAKNVAWLHKEVDHYSDIWDDYWDTLLTREAYRAIDRPRDLLTARARVKRGDLFLLPKHQWGIGTLFFVAESISEQEREFRLAVQRFIGSLVEGAPFAAAFMRNSSGYYVDQLRFPAVAVNEADVEHVLAPLVRDVKLESIRSNEPLRHGYDGMIVAVGTAGGRTRG